MHGRRGESGVEIFGGRRGERTRLRPVANLDGGEDVGRPGIELTREEAASLARAKSGSSKYEDATERGLEQLGMNPNGVHSGFEE